MSFAPLAQSADKQVLFARLGLSEQTHKILLQEAQNARDSLSRNPQNLTDHSRTNPNIRTPYKWDEISETAKHREILTLVNNAPPHSKYYYTIGQYQTNVNEENWVARWYLWHSFRYRDNRDTRSRPSTVTPVDPLELPYWDPVHNCYRYRAEKLGNPNRQSSG